MPNRPYLALPALIGALLGTGVGAYAQTASTAAPPAISTPAPGASPAVAGHKRHRHGNRMMRTLRTLGLSATQKAQIKTALQSYRTSRTSATPETKAQLRTQIENILTPSQRTQFEAAMQRKRRTPMEPMAPAASPTP